MIRRTTQYALNVLRCLARDPDQRVSADKLSQETGIPANYLSKILSQLRKHRFVEGEKGWRGGFRLRPGVLDRPIHNVTRVFEKDPTRTRVEECIFGLGPCDSTRPCSLHSDWERIRTARDAMLMRHTVRDLVRSRAGRKR